MCVCRKDTCSCCVVLYIDCFRVDTDVDGRVMIIYLRRHEYTDGTDCNCAHIDVINLMCNPDIVLIHEQVHNQRYCASHSGPTAVDSWMVVECVNILVFEVEYVSMSIALCVVHLLVGECGCMCLMFVLV